MNGSPAEPGADPEPGHAALRRASRPHLALAVGLGTVLQDHYRLSGTLEVGDVATVYRGEEIETGRAVAVTVFHEIGRNARGRIEDLHRPRPRGASPLVLPSVFAAVHACDLTDDGRLFVVTELLEGPSIAELLKRAPLSPARALEVAMRVGEAVEVVLNLGALDVWVAPRDVVLLDKGDRPKLRRSDMLIVRRLGLADALAAAEAPGRDPRYASPEELARVAVTEGSLVYRFGILLYELLGGSPPFDGTTPAEVRDQQLRRSPMRLQDRHRALPPSVDRLVAQMLAPDPAVRPVDLTWILNELWDAACHLRAMAPDDAASSPGARPSPSTERRWARRLAMAGLSVLSLGGVLAAWPYLASRPPTPTAGPSPVRSPASVSTPTEVAAPAPGPPSPSRAIIAADSAPVDAALDTPPPRRRATVAGPVREPVQPPPPPASTEASKREPAPIPADPKPDAPRSAPTPSSNPPAPTAPPARPRPSVPEAVRATDPGAIIDWLLRDSPKLGD
jgi:eukaryotic-like serine/threonine-protein kinase